MSAWFLLVPPLYALAAIMVFLGGVTFFAVVGDPNDQKFQRDTLICVSAILLGAFVGGFAYWLQALIS